jgi:tRNA-splicing ligase RtcB
MKDVFSTSVGKGTLDESPFAYKDSKMIEDAIGPTADIIDRIIPIHNMKDSDGERDE